MIQRNVITIRKVLDCGLNEYINYKDQLLVSFIKNLSLFSVPCHLQATTILVCLSGELDCSVNLNNHKLGKYSVLINFPENIIQTHRVTDLRAFAIILSTEFLHSLSMEMLSLTHYYNYELNRNESFTLSREMVKTLSSYLTLLRNTISSPLTSDNDDLVKHLAMAFVTHVMTLHHHYHKNQVQQREGSKSSFMMLDCFIDLVGRYHSQEREVRFYADKMSISPRYLSRVIQKSSGKKAAEWICEFVIMEAKSLLRYSGMNVQEVSRQLNFPSQSAFGKYFKNQVGMSPSEFLCSIRRF